MASKDKRSRLKDHRTRHNFSHGLSGLRLPVVYNSTIQYNTISFIAYREVSADPAATKTSDMMGIIKI